MPGDREGWDAAGERVETQDEYEERQAAHEVAEQGCCQTWVGGVQCNRPRYRVGSDLCEKHDTAENEVAALRARVARLTEAGGRLVAEIQFAFPGATHYENCGASHPLCAALEAWGAALAEEPPK